jgi:hypothetical protein
MQTLYNLYAPLTQKRILQIIYQSNTITQQQFVFKNIGSRHNIIQQQQPVLWSDLRVYIEILFCNSLKTTIHKQTDSSIQNSLESSFKTYFTSS